METKVRRIKIDLSRVPDRAGQEVLLDSSLRDQALLSDEFAYSPFSWAFRNRVEAIGTPAHPGYQDKDNLHCCITQGASGRLENPNGTATLYESLRTRSGADSDGQAYLAVYHRLMLKPVDDAQIFTFVEPDRKLDALVAIVEVNGID